jgi:type 1 fimbria pilin
MKLTHILVSALTMAAMAQAHAQTLNMELTGTIKPASCQWRIGDDNRSIALDPIGINALPASGRAATVPFTLQLQNCGANISQVQFGFSGRPEPGDPAQYLNLDAAEGVAVNLADRAGVTLRADGAGSSRIVPIADGAVSIDLNASYWRLPGQAVKTGTVRAVATVTVQYL